MSKHFSIRESLAFGVSTFRKHPWFFIAITFFGIFSSIIFSYLVDLFIALFLSKAGDSAIAIVQGLGSLTGSLLNMLIQLGMTRIYLSAVDGKILPFGTLFHAKGLYVPYMVLSFVTGLAVVLGYIFLIIPGVILSLMFYFSHIALVDDNLGVIESLQTSRKISEGVWLKLILFSLVSAGVIILGFLFVGVGIFVAIPVVTLAQIYIYRSLKSQTLSLVPTE